MKKLLIVPVLIAAFFVSGCNSLATAQSFEDVINGILNVAKAEIPELPPADGAILTQWTNLGTTLAAQNQTCINAAAAGGGKNVVFLACFNAFAIGLTSPAELAQLRLLSATGQGKAELWATAIILGVNGALSAFKGTALPMPIVASVALSHRDLEALARQVGVPSGYGF